MQLWGTAGRAKAQGCCSLVEPAEDALAAHWGLPGLVLLGPAGKDSRDDAAATVAEKAT